MKRNQTSMTAKGIAAIRAVESEKPQDVRICYDPLARDMAGYWYYLLVKVFSAYGEKKGPGTQTYLVCRCRYFDDTIHEYITRGIDQLVILGAGLDSRAYRGEVFESTVRVFEVDQLATQARKINRVKRILKKIPESVVYVPIDFNTETMDKLISFGFSRSLKSLFIWEGVTYYLTAEAVDATLAWIHSNAAAGSGIIFDYLYKSALTTAEKRGEIKRMQRYRRFTGEGLSFGIERGLIDQLLSQKGYKNIKNIDSSQLTTLYCNGANEGRLVGDVYAIGTAEVGDTVDHDSKS